VNTEHPSNKRFLQTLEDMRALSEKKQRDYGSDSDPFANVREGAIDMGMQPWVGAALRMNDKMRRINKAARLGPESLNFDSLEDDFIDMANYAVIGKALLDEWQEGRKAETNV
jgi:hypothetical protein